MGLFAALALVASQDSALPLPPDADRTVPLEAPRTEPESKPLAAPPETPRRLDPGRAEAGPSLSTFFFWSAVVIALLVGSFLLFKRFSRNSRFFAAATAVDLLARKSLGGKNEIFVVEVGGKVLVVGSSRDRLSPLGEISDADAVARLRARVRGGKGEAEERVFGDSLKSGLQEYEKGPNPETKAKEIFDELAELKKTVSSWKA
jgi:flagellar biogenesis protein FliO